MKLTKALPAYGLARLNEAAGERDFGGFTQIGIRDVPVPVLLACILPGAPQRRRRKHHGELTPRQRPYFHGIYHRAPSGLVAGTLSIPEVPKG